MSDEELEQEEDELQEIDEEEEGEGEDEPEEEWIGGEEWGEEEEEDQIVELEPPKFVDNEDGTVSDPRQQVMWAKVDSWKEFGYGINWIEANEYCEALNEKKFAGYDDWRLPGWDEAKGLFSFEKSNYDKDGAEIHIDPVFEPEGGHNTWTYDEKPDYPHYARKFSYITGNDMWENKDNEYTHARPVRDEKKDEWEPEWRKDTKKFSG